MYYSTNLYCLETHESMRWDKVTGTDRFGSMGLSRLKVRLSCKRRFYSVINRTSQLDLAEQGLGAEHNMASGSMTRAVFDTLIQRCIVTYYLSIIVLIQLLYRFRNTCAAVDCA